jgi:hypothetical protein
VHKYVKGTLTTHAEHLTCFHRGRRIKQYPYTVTKPKGSSERRTATKYALKTVNNVLLYDNYCRVLMGQQAANRYKPA